MSMHHPNEYSGDYYDAMHKEYLRIQEDVLNTMASSVSNNTDKL